MARFRALQPHPIPIADSMISGGGIGGLILACALSRAQDIAIDVYEGAAAFGDIGAGITLRKRTMPFLAELGLIEEILAINGSSQDNASSTSACELREKYYH